ncbi:hypothetical protein MNBD_NITROSPINAE01-249 [hydrothermal vent metagenome]|uniref:PilZ domain-containing protein n=1 Tax=hydrothermal vent metagenome TaxID=652676 RepID=A0A3B1CCS1_9ZZZZ
MDAIKLNLCPECNRAFFAIQAEFRPPCNHCGYSLIDHRLEPRINIDIGFTVNAKNEMIYSILRDYSDSGARIAYEGKPLPVNSTMDINLEEPGIHRQGRAVWSKAINGSISQTGFKLT